MKISIDRHVLGIFPDMEVYGLLMTGVDKDSVNEVDFYDIEAIDVNLSQAETEKWTMIYDQFPHPKKARVSIKYLIEAWFKRKLKKITPIIDVYNCASLISLCPIGGEDFDKLSTNDLTLALSSGREKFTPFNSLATENPLPKEVIGVTDENVVVCRSMNFIESNDYKITDDTTDILFLIEKPLLSLNGNPMKAFSFIKEKLSNPGTPTREFTLNSQNTSLTL